MIRRHIETLTQKYKDANVYDPRMDPNATGWYFPGQQDLLTSDPLPSLNEESYLDSEEMIRLIEEGINATQREMASVALRDTVDASDSYNI